MNNVFYSDDSVMAFNEHESSTPKSIENNEKSLLMETGDSTTLDSGIEELSKDSVSSKECKNSTGIQANKKKREGPRELKESMEREKEEAKKIKLLEKKIKIEKMQQEKVKKGQKRKRPVTEKVDNKTEPSEKKKSSEKFQE